MGRKSTIDGLPDAIRAKLDRLLLHQKVTIEGATRYLNEWLKAHAADAGNSSEEPAPGGAGSLPAAALPPSLVVVSKSAVGRYKLSLEEMTAEIAETDRLAAIMLKELNITNQSNVAQATAETLRVMLMRFIPMLRGAMQSEELSIKDMKDVTGMLKDLTAGHERLENSATINQKRLLEAKREAAKDLVDKAENLPAGQALTADRLRQLLKETYGG